MIQIHRFHDKVAVFLGGETTYLPPKTARRLARVLGFAADDIEQVPSFRESKAGTFRMNEKTGEIE